MTYTTPTITPYIIMSGLATSRTNAKRSRKDNGSINSGFATVGGSAAPTKNTGNTNNALKSKTPLQAALVSQKLSYASLPKVSHPVLMPITEKTLREFATYYYAKEKTEWNEVQTELSRQLRKEAQHCTIDRVE